MKQYLDLGKKILEEGKARGDRTGTGTVSLFGTEMRFDLKEGFPLVTTKKTAFWSMLRELLWFLKGSTNNKELNEMGCKIWDEWALDDGSLGPIYGKQWTAWEDIKLVPVEVYDRMTPNTFTMQGYEFHDDYLDTESGEYIAILKREINQIQNVIDSLKNSPMSRRHIVSAWNPADLPVDGFTPHENVEMGNAALAFCHAMFQFYVRKFTFDERLELSESQKTKDLGKDDSLSRQMEASELLENEGVPEYGLSCKVTQRSMDFSLGAPFNIASYALLTQMIAQCVDMAPDELIMEGGDTHIYLNHIDAFKEQLTRKPKKLPTVRLNPEIKDVFDFKEEDFELVGYKHHEPIKYEVSV